MTDGKREIVSRLIQEYNIKNAQDIQNALKDLLGSSIKEMMEAEMDDHLGRKKSKRINSEENLGKDSRTRPNRLILVMAVFYLKFLKIETQLLNLK